MGSLLSYRWRGRERSGRDLAPTAAIDCLIIFSLPGSLLVLVYSIRLSVHKQENGKETARSNRKHGIIIVLLLLSYAYILHYYYCYDQSANAANATK